MNQDGSAASGEGVEGTEPPEETRLRAALALALPGELIFIELDDAGERARLPVLLGAAGLARPWLYVNLREDSVLFGVTQVEQREPLPQVVALGDLPAVLRGLLTSSWAQAPRLVFLDGLEQVLDAEQVPQPGGPLEQLSQGREALATLPAALVFLLPASLVQHLREHAINLWSWRAYDFTLSGEGAPELTRLVLPGPSVRLRSPRGDSHEARTRHIQIYRDLLQEHEARGRLLGSLYSEVIAPLLTALDDEGAWAEALELAQRVLREDPPPPPAIVADLRAQVAHLLFHLDRIPEAMSVVEEARTLSAELPWVERRRPLDIVAIADRELGQSARTEPLLRQTLADAQDDPRVSLAGKVLGTTWVIDKLVGSLLAQNRLSEAEDLLHQARSAAVAALGPTSEYVILLDLDVFLLRVNQKRYAEARRLGHALLPIIEARFNNSSFHRGLLRFLAHACVQLRDWSGAERSLRAALEMQRWVAQQPDASPQILLALGEVCSAQNKAEAESHFLAGLQGLRVAKRRDLALYFELAHHLGACYMSRRAPQAAQQLMEEVLCVLEAAPKMVATPLLGRCYANLGMAHLGQKQPVLAETYLRQALPLCTDPEARGRLLTQLAESLRQQGRPVEATEQAARGSTLNELLKSPVVPAGARRGRRP